MSVEQKRAYNKLKHDLEPWRNLIVHLDSVLSWEKSFYPAVIAAAITTFYLLLWALDMSTVTTLALAGLFALAIDFVYPSVSRFFFSPDNWNGNQEEQFERVCTQLCNLKLMLGGWYEYLFSAKERKSTLFVTIMSVALLSLAWIGAIINNLLLMYLITMVLTLYPGIQEKGVFYKIKDYFGCAVNSKLQQLREKNKKAD
ncbi:ADP-ribosylation factor-like protein 6-interacting protein 1 isoform X1 [Anastrepha obliqua]|uniref:ADP-ribosylation factor-like protein 6-interacting protein 1 isoform X1 n=1 Tax=Anastrepha obliqua TaxID=95512 RepID=UPI002409E47D|nr:ADP-ribosylation factor-like protein 6-interacting protein 1 isoform X1 [Anastrepha obliqua]